MQRISIFENSAGPCRGRFSLSPRWPCSSSRTAAFRFLLIPLILCKVHTYISCYIEGNSWWHFGYSWLSLIKLPLHSRQRTLMWPHPYRIKESAGWLSFYDKALQRINLKEEKSISLSCPWRPMPAVLSGRTIIGPFPKVNESGGENRNCCYGEYEECESSEPEGMPFSISLYRGYEIEGNGNTGDILGELVKTEITC